MVHNDLIEHGFDTFMDVENLDSGEFVRRVLSQIEAREHFIVLLQPGSLDRIGEDDDWLHREIAHALAHGRNVVPVTADGFGFRRDLVLPPDVARLPSLNAVVIQPDYFPAAMEKLRTRFLKTPPKPETLNAPQLSGQWDYRHPVALSWSEVPGADEYVLEQTKSYVRHFEILPVVHEVYRGPEWSYHDCVALGDNQLDTPALLSYRVRASVSGQAGKWSDVLRFRTPVYPE